VFAILTLDSQNRVINYHELFFGSVNEAKIHARLVIEKIFEDNAASVIFCHNHPSGSVKPSGADNKLTTEFKNHLNFFGIHLIDHVIVGNNEHYSYAERGL
jgi:DNA repair protein RadC